MAKDEPKSKHIDVVMNRRASIFAAKPKELENKFGIIMFDQVATGVGCGHIVERRDVAWERLWHGNGLTPCGMTEFCLKAGERKALQEQPQLTFKVVMLRIACRPSEPKVLAQVLVEGLKIGMVECLIRAASVLLFRPSQYTVSIEVPTCGIAQRIGVFLHNASESDVHMKVWVEGRFIPGYAQ